MFKTFFKKSKRKKFLILPVPWQSTVYLIENNDVEPCTVVDYDIEFDIHTGEVHKDAILKHQSAGFSIFCPEDDFGRIVFKSKAAANRALKRQRKEIK